MTTDTKPAHTPAPNTFGEPWREGIPPDSIVCDFAPDADTDLETLRHYGGQLVAESLRPYRRHRVIACVNSLAGLNPEAVAGLVAAAQTVQRFSTAHRVNPGDRTVRGIDFKALCAALAKITG